MNPLPLIALVDPDATGLATLTYGFERAGYTVAGTSDPKMAPQAIRATQARVVVVSLRLPERETVDLISGLRIHPETQRVPVVALGPAELRPAALGAGAFDYLNTPIFVRDAIVVSHLVSLMQPAPADGGSMPDIQVPLSQLHGLFSLIRAMTSTGRSGVLQLTHGNRKGEVKFSGGAVTSAQVRALQAFPALHQLLLWKEASLSLKLRDVPPRGQFSLGGDEIVDECDRFLRDFAHAAAELGDGETVYAYDGTRGARNAGSVPGEVAPVARLFDGQRTMGDVIEESPFRIFDTLRVIKRLIESGALVPQQQKATQKTAPKTTPKTAENAAPVAIVGEAAVVTAPLRSRTQTAPRGVPRPTPAAGSTALGERRGLAGDRRKLGRRTPHQVAFGKPAVTAAPILLVNKTPAPIPLVAKTPAPIPLTEKKSGGPPVAATAGEIAPRKPLSSSAKAYPPVSGEGPTVQVKLDRPETAPRPRPATEARDRLSLDMAVPIGAPQSEAPPRPKKQHPGGGGHGAATPAPAFDALESDFFAREADLYKKEAVDSFEDLERGGTDPNIQKIRQLRLAAGQRTSARSKKK
jgi:CheY-like chemotaxis protein